MKNALFLPCQPFTPHLFSPLLSSPPFLPYHPLLPILSSHPSPPFPSLKSKCFTDLMTYEWRHPRRARCSCIGLEPALMIVIQVCMNDVVWNFVQREWCGVVEFGELTNISGSGNKGICTLLSAPIVIYCIFLVWECYWWSTYSKWLIFVFLSEAVMESTSLGEIICEWASSNQEQVS